MTSLGIKALRHLEGGYEITVEDDRGRVKKAAMWSYVLGDVVLTVCTGWGKFWMTDNERYNGSRAPASVWRRRQVLWSEKQIVKAGADNLGQSK